MGISGAVDWWEEWQLRILVLGSLFVQWLLFLSSIHRKRAIPSWFRSIIWLAYLGSDALAIYGLATLFNRHRKQDYGSNRSSILEVVWAPVLLMHLGGQDCITAYNIEDNELWTRHTLTAVSQITVAIYAFSKSWPGDDKMLLLASILFFILGIFKCMEKPLALKSSSFSSLVSLANPYPGMTSRSSSKAGPLFPGTTSKADHHSRMASRIGKTISLEDYVQKARAFVLAKCNPRARGEGVAIDLEHNHVPQVQGEADKAGLVGNHHHQVQGKGDAADLKPNHPTQAQGEADAVNLGANHHCQVHEEAEDDDLKPNHSPQATWVKKLFARQHQPYLSWKAMRGRLATKRRLMEKLNLGAQKLFVDLASLYHDRLSILETFLVHDVDEDAYDLLQEELFQIFDLLYTKRTFTEFSRISGKKLTPVNYFSATIRTACIYLPFAAIAVFHKSHRGAYNVNDVKVTYALFCCTAMLEILSMSVGPLKFRPSMVAQYSLVGFFVRNRRHNKKMSFLTSLNCKDFLDQRWCMKSCYSSSRITGLVLGHVKGWWKEHIVDAGSYRRFNDHRGQWTVYRTGCFQDLEWSLNRPLDESVLLWHIATDLCFFQNGGPSVSHEKTTVCREISNYMIYLLFVNPEMLLPGTRRNLFLEANAELEEILESDKPLLSAIIKGNKASLVEILKGKKPFPQFVKEKGPSPEETERGLMERIIAKLQPTECREEDPIEEQYPAAQEGFIQDAWKISAVLLDLGDEKMWEVIEGVWVEMLCFSASRCRGFLHAKSMGSGVELLTYIWFLLFCMGMETLPERLQRTEHSSGEGYAGATPSTSEVSATTGEEIV